MLSGKRRPPQPALRDPPTHTESTAPQEAPPPGDAPPPLLIAHLEDDERDREDRRVRRAVAELARELHERDREHEQDEDHVHVAAPPACAADEPVVVVEVVRAGGDLLQRVRDQYDRGRQPEQLIRVAAGMRVRVGGYSLNEWWSSEGDLLVCVCATRVESTWLMSCAASSSSRPRAPPMSWP